MPNFVTLDRYVPLGQLISGPQSNRPGHFGAKPAELRAKKELHHIRNETTDNSEGLELASFVRPAQSRHTSGLGLCGFLTLLDDPIENSIYEFRQGYVKVSF
jgi:hypothetical protein